MSQLIQSLWVGRKLSVMERLSIASFLANGHEYHLYAYEEIENAPAGTVIRAADEILHPSKIFLYKKFPSHAGFSNFFRYKLLLTRGGWWVDTDVVCLKPFHFDTPYVFASERLKDSAVPTTAVMKAPAGCQLMESNWQVCADCVDPSDVVWGEHGPKLMAKGIARHGLESFLQAPEVFCPLAWDESEILMQPGSADDYGPATRAVHLWNEMWRRNGRDKDGSYPPETLYEQLKRAYLPQCSN